MALPGGAVETPRSTAWQMPICQASPRVEDIAALAIRVAVQRGRKPTTLENKRHAWECKIVPALQGRDAAHVSHDEACEIADAWASTAGPHAALKAAREAGHGWKLAIRRGWMLRSPWDGVEVSGASRGLQRLMPPDARRRFARYLRPIALHGAPSPYRRVTAMALLWLGEVPAGRMAEAASLEWSGVDLERGVVTWWRHKRDRRGPKHAVLTSFGRQILLAAHEVTGGSRWVFDRGDGAPVHDLTKSMARVCQRLGLDRYTPHDLRRGIAQEAIDAGASLEDVQALLGHESRTTTEAYLRWSSARARRAHELVTLGDDNQ